MWWPRRGNCGGSFLPEEKKANMWHRRGYNGGSRPPAFPRSSESYVATFLLLMDATLRCLALFVFYNCLLIYTTDRSKISSDQKGLIKP